MRSVFCAFLVILLTATPAFAQPTAEDILAGMRARFAALKDYRCLVEARADRPKPGQMLIRYTFSKPRRIRMEFQRPRRGAVAIYTGGDRVRVRRFRWLPITLTFAVTDARMKSPQGHRVDQTDFGAFIEDVAQDAARGTLTYGGEETVEGRRAHRLELVRPAPTTTRDYRRMVLHVDAEAGLPLRVETFGWDGGRIETVVFRELKVDVGVTDEAFDF